MRVEQGNVVYVDDAGNARPLSSEGLDADPVLAPDGRIVVFVRRGGGSYEWTGLVTPSSKEIKTLEVEDATASSPKK